MTGYLGQRRVDRRLGQVPVSSYGPGFSSGKRAALESAVKAWIASGPGTFRSKDSVNPYRPAFESFCRFASDLEVGQDAFEICLSREGYRAGSVVFDGEILWLLILPKKTNKEV